MERATWGHICQFRQLFIVTSQDIFTRNDKKKRGFILHNLLTFDLKGCNLYSDLSDSSLGQGVHSVRKSVRD